MESASSSSPSSSIRDSANLRRDSLSSDEDGLREVLAEELEGLEMQELDRLDNLDLGLPNLAANQQNPRFNAAWDRDQSSIAKKLGFIWSLGIIIYLLCFAFGYLILVVQPWQSCKRHLYMWAVATILLHVIMTATKTHLLIFIWRNVQSFDNLDPYVQRRLSILYFINRLLNYIWMAWWLTGTVLRFGKADCEATTLMSLMLVQFIIQWCIAGLVLLATCCSCGVIAFLYYFYPHALMGGERIVGATHAQIAKLKEEKYDPANTTVKTEDATCAICLSPYEKSDKLRHLPCKHHFHSECIDQWLLKNKSCPFCKRNIDQEANPSAPEQVDEELGLVELEHTEDSPINAFPVASSSSSS